MCLMNSRLCKKTTHRNALNGHKKYILSISITDKCHDFRLYINNNFYALRNGLGYFFYDKKLLNLYTTYPTN